jgi:hypothetical protein
MKIAENRSSNITKSDESPPVRNYAQKLVNAGLSGFKSTYNQIQKMSATKDGSDELRTIQSGDTLTGIIKDQFKSRYGKSTPISEGQAYRFALNLAKKNNISNANNIYPGQIIDMSSVFNTDVTLVKVNERQEEINYEIDKKIDANMNNHVYTRQNNSGILGDVLRRAVKKGYIPQEDMPIIEDKIFQMAQKHKFRVDDLAHAVMMESDGFNPAASNGHCFGIIQFCSGANSGAASVGYAYSPMDIKKLSVLQQLQLVDKYFDDTQLNRYTSRNGYVNLDDLYLTILTPAARQEKNQFKPLPIPGLQALALHPGKNRQLPITRDSIVNGLNELTYRKLKMLK